MNLLVALAAAALAPILSATAQYQPTGPDGITASPRFRKMLQDTQLGARTAPAAQSKPGMAHPRADGIAASPKARALMEQRTVPAGVAPGTALRTTRPPGEGVAASLKARELLRRRITRRAVELAPITQ